MDSDFYLDINGEAFALVENLNIISGEASKDQTTSHVIIIPNKNLSIKHAVIKVTDSQECQIMDICSGIIIRNSYNEEENMLPMKWYRLNVGQSIFLGLAEAVLKENKGVNKSNTSTSFQEVPATEDLLETDHFTLTHVYIPETQDIFTQHYETDSYQIKQESQSNYSDHPEEDDERNRELLDTFHDELISKEHDNSDYDDRDGSITPELRLEDFTSVVVKEEPLTQNYDQSDVATQLFRPEILQSDIATQRFLEPEMTNQHPVTNNDSLYSCETQQLTLIDNSVKTRKRTNAERLKISRIASIAVFDIATQPMLVKPMNKQIYDAATQVVDVSHMNDSPVKASATKQPLRNRVFDSSDDDDEEYNTPLKSISISQGDKTPEFIPKFNTGSQMDRDIDEVNLSQNSDDEFSFLIANGDSDHEDLKTFDAHPVKPLMKQTVVKKTNSKKNLMKYADSESVMTPKKVQKDPKSTKTPDSGARISIRRDSLRSSGNSPAVVNGINKRRDSLRPSVSQVVPSSASKVKDSTKTSEHPVKPQFISKRRDSLRSASSSRDSTGSSYPSPPVSSTVSEETSETTSKSSLTEETSETSSKSSLNEGKTPAKQSNSKVSTRSRVTRSSKSPPTNSKRTHSPPSKDPNLKLPLAENILKNQAKRKCPEVIPEPQYIVAVTNFAERSKIIKYCDILGFQLNDEILLANVLISNHQIKFTSKFLAAMCKRIPIVTIEWLDKCVKRKKALNPMNFIIIDRDCERSKKFTMMKLYQKTEIRFLKNYSVYVTPNTKPPFAELNNILQCAGAECLDLSQTATNSDIIGIANLGDIKEIKKLKKRFGMGFKILPDTSICELVIHQKLKFNHKCPWEIS